MFYHTLQDMLRVSIVFEEFYPLSSDEIRSYPSKSYPKADPKTESTALGGIKRGLSQVKRKLCYLLGLGKDTNAPAHDLAEYSKRYNEAAKERDRLRLEGVVRYEDEERPKEKKKYLDALKQVIRPKKKPPTARVPLPECTLERIKLNMGVHPWDFIPELPYCPNEAQLLAIYEERLKKMALKRRAAEKMEKKRKRALKVAAAKEKRAAAAAMQRCMAPELAKPDDIEMQTIGCDSADAKPMPRSKIKETIEVLQGLGIC